MFRAPLLAALCVCLPVATMGASSKIPVNELGMPVQNARGERISYTPEDLAARTVAIQKDGSPTDGSLAPSGVTARWAYAGFGTGIGLSAIVLADGEIYTGGGQTGFGANEYWYALRRIGGSYEQVFVSRSLPGTIGLAVADVRGDARKEVVVAQSNGNVVLFDQRSREELVTLVVPASGVAGMTVRDLDNDGKAEILLTTSSTDTLYVVSGTGAVLWQRAAAGGVDVAVGNMDGDASLEIATTSGAVLDWATRTLQWQRTQGVPAVDVEAADIDGDGKEELIAAQDWSFVWAFDVDTQLPKWSIPMSDIDALWVGNVDSDPDIEILVGDGQWGEVHAFNSITQAEEWLIANPEHGVTNIAVGDPDGNGVRDVLWGAGATSSGSDRLYVANLVTRTIDWENEQLDGPFLPPVRGDIDGDGIPELITASTEAESGYDSGRLVVLDGATLAVKGISAPIVDNQSWTGLHDLRLRNVDSDPALEIVVAADRLYDGVIEIYDFANGAFTLKWTNGSRPSGSPFYTADVADVDGDGQLEVVGGVGRAHSGSPGIFVYTYSYPGGGEEWRTFALGTSGRPITGLALLTAGGGVGDVVAMVDGESLNFFTGANQIQAIVSGTYTSLGPDSSTSARSFLTGDSVGTLRQHQRQGPGYTVTWTRNLGGPRVDGVTLLPGGEMGVTAAGRLTLYPQRDAPSSWTSEDYGVRGGIVAGAGVTRRPFAGGRYALVGLAPWRTLLDVQPPSGPFTGGTTLTVTGTAFAPAAQLFVGSRQAVGVQVADPSHATATTPVLRACSINPVTVVNPDMSFETRDDAFTATRAGDNWNRCTTEASIVATIMDAPVAGALVR